MSDIPWAEKYRPTLLSDVCGNEEMISRLAVLAKNGKMPHLILSGPPGCGKTTSIWCLANQLLGPEFSGNAIMELNASNDRSVSVVREDIKMFCRRHVSLPPGKHKIVILDEVDSMTEGAQQALRRIMEVYSSGTRFALACNYSSKIIEPIQSRCVLLRFSRLNDKQVLKRLIEICDKECAKYTLEGLESIIFVSEGDMRRALNIMQSTISGFSIINPENVFKFCDSPNPLIMKKILRCCLDVNPREAVETLCSLWNSGYNPMDIVNTLFKVAKLYECGDQEKLEIIRLIGKSHLAMSNGCCTLIQLTGLAAEICFAAQKKD